MTSTAHSEVRDRQRPLKRRYGECPSAARSPKWARTSSRTIAPTDPFHGEAEIGRGYDATFRYGLDRGVGGLHDLPNPGDLLCATLATCFDGSIRMIADLMGIELDDVSVEVSGEVDLRGTLLVEPTAPVGFTSLVISPRVGATGADPAQVATLLALAEQTCVTLSTLRNGVTVELDGADR
jgi:uncharacterized OsmC-like protein